MGRAPCCQKVGLKKGPWTPEEDQLLIAYINQHGHGSWRALPQNAGLLRCGKSCRLRWTNYLRPDIKRGKFSASEEQSIIQLHALLGNRWSAIATHLPKRTDNEIKNYWNTHLKKRLVKMGIDPATHKRKMDTASNLLEANGSSNSALSHMTQWESARLEAEARLARESKMRAKGLWPQVVSHDESSSARRPWHSQARQGFSSVEALRNWEKSLQGQAGFLWPDSWNSTNSVPDGQDTSCCSSPHADRMDHGSPTSTSCSLKLRKIGTADSSSFFAFQKLRWTDSSTTAAMKEFSSESVAGLENDKFLPPCSFQMDEILHNSCEEVAITCKADGESLPSLQCTQNNLAVSMVGNTTTTSGSLASPRWSQSSEEDFSMDVYKKETESIPMLDSATTSNSLLCELDLVCEDISSNKSCLASINCTDMPSEFLVDLLNVHCETSSGSGIQDNYNDLLTEDNPDCWNNMLMQLADSTTQPAAASF